MSTDQSKADKAFKVPPYIGLKPLEGRYYAAECQRCGWVGSSEECTEDAQCARIDGGRMCLGDIEEIGADLLLGIIQGLTQGQGEVERLQRRIQNAELALKAQTQNCNTLRAQLADLKQRHDGLHRDMYTIAAREVPKGCTVADYAAASIADALSASTEPAALHAKPVKLNRCTSCEDCRGFNTGHDSSQQKPHSIRCDNCGKEARAHEHMGLTEAWNEINPRPAEVASTEPSVPASCTWTYNNDDSFAWGTSCSNSFTLMEDGPRENGMKFCPYCSKPINQVSTSEEQSEGGAV